MMPDTINQKTHKKQKILLGIPTLDGRFDYRFLSALLPTLDLLREQHIEYQLGLEIGCSLIADARNRIAHRFLNDTEFSDLVFIDADIAWQPEDLMRLLGWDVPLVGGIYQKKSKQLSFAVKFSSTIESRGGLLTAQFMGTGFMRIRRDCFTTMIAQGDKIGLQQYVLPGREQDVPVQAFFNTCIDTYYMGEDYFFCDLWRRCGQEVLLDPTINLQHIGTRVYDEPISKYLEAKT